MDPRNALSMAAVLGAILREARAEGYYPETILSTDVTSILLDFQKDAALVSEETRAALAGAAKCPSTTTEMYKARGIQLMVTISAAGKLVCTIVMIKDNNFPHLEKVKVFKTNNFNTLILHEKYLCFFAVGRGW